MTQEPIKEPKPKRRFRPILHTLYLLLFCIFMVLVKIFFMQTAKPTITVDYATKLNDLTRPENYDPDQNAAPLYKKANDANASFYRNLQEVTENFTDHNNGLGISLDALNPEELEKLRDLLSQNDQAIKLTLSASKKPYSWSPVTTFQDQEWLYFPNIGNKFTLSRMLLLQSKLRMFDNDPDAAFEHLAASFNIAIQSEAMLAGQTMYVNTRIRTDLGIALNAILDQNNIEPAYLESLQQLLTDHPPAIDIESALEVERLFLLDIIQRIYTDDGNGDGNVIPPKVMKLWGNSSHGRRPYVSDWLDIEEVFDAFCDFFKNIADNTQQTYLVLKQFQPRKATVENLEKLHRTVAKTLPLTPATLHAKGTTHRQKIESALDLKANLLLANSPMTAMAHHHYKSLTHHNALITNIAIHRYKADIGQFPASLDDLITAGYITELPLDPYSDKPFAYSLTDDTYKLYSFGLNCNDDGGKEQDMTSMIFTGDDLIFWPPKSPKRFDPATIKGMPGMGMPGIPGVRRPAIEQPPTDPNQIT